MVVGDRVNSTAISGNATWKMPSARFDIPDDAQSFQKPAPSGPEVSAAGGLTSGVGGRGAIDGELHID